ncbi:MAG TPA: hypothetical protein PLZ55_03730 [bacterium]|nr:hypothetical protein [bacterium]HPO07755.1 hypothetical protein [bacterium]HQP96907.1 hypothetical protein [bacterium]
MNRRPTYSPEYVELRTAIEHVTARVEGIQMLLRDIQRDFARTESMVLKNRSDIAAIKITASLLGAAAGAFIGLFGKSWWPF